MAFVVDHQARFSAHLVEIDERIIKIADGVDSLRAGMSSLTGALLSLTNIAERHEDEISTIAQMHRETTERSDTLITFFERQSGGNGK